MKFKDLKINDWFRLEPHGRSYQKTSYSGYFVDRTMGEMQVNPEMTIHPIDSKNPPVAHV